MSGLGTPEVLIIFVLLGLLVLPMWAIIDALVRPDSQWATADQHKVAWVVARAVGTCGLGPAGPRGYCSESAA